MIISVIHVSNFYDWTETWHAQDSKEIVVLLVEDFIALN